MNIINIQVNKETVYYIYIYTHFIYYIYISQYQLRQSESSERTARNSQHITTHHQKLRNTVPSPSFWSCLDLTPLSGPLPRTGRTEGELGTLERDSGAALEGALVESDWMESCTFPEGPSSHDSAKMAAFGAVAGASSNWIADFTGASSLIVFAANAVLQRLRTLRDAAKIRNAAPVLFRATGSHDRSFLQSLQMSRVWTGPAMSTQVLVLLLWLLLILWSAIPVEKDATPASTPGCWALTPHPFIMENADAVIEVPGISVKCERST